MLLKYHWFHREPAPNPPAGGGDNPPAPNPGDTPPAGEGDKPGENDKPADDVPAGDDPPVSEEDAPAEFWNRVNSLRGDDQALDIQPLLEQLKDDILSPEGVKEVITLAEKAAIERHERERAAANPRVYAYELHKRAGGSDEEFFNEKIPTLPAIDELRNNIDLQKSFYSNVLKAKGVPDIAIEATLEKLEKEKKLFDEVNKAHAAAAALELTQVETLQKRVKEQEEQYEAAVLQLDKNLRGAVATGEGMSIVIPDAEREKFINFIAPKLMYLPDGNFAVVDTIGKDNLGKLIESLYFQYTGGNLQKMVAKAATTQNAGKVKLYIKREKQPDNGANTPGTSTKKTLAELTGMAPKK